MSLRRVGVVTLLILSLAPVASSQIAAAPAFALARPVASGALDVSIAFSAEMRDGAPVRELRPEDLRVVDNGMLITNVREVIRERDLPLQLTVVLDRSGSITPAQQRQLDSVTELLQGDFQPSRDALDIWAFDDHPTRLGTWKDSGEHRLEIPLDELTTYQTALFDSLITICNAAGKQPQNDSRRVLVLISDGEDNNSKSSLQDAIDAAQRAGITIYAMAIRLNGWDAGKETLQELAARTGGMYLDAHTDKRMYRAMAALSEELRQQWRVVYRVPEMRGIVRHALELEARSPKILVRATSAWHQE